MPHQGVASHARKCSASDMKRIHATRTERGEVALRFGSHRIRVSYFSTGGAMDPNSAVLHPYARKPVQCGGRVDIDISSNRFYSRNNLPVSVSGMTHLGNARGGA